ncbi:MAG: hypothetical protein ACD_39C02099G0004, partial [uncultured bacterium]
MKKATAFITLILSIAAAAGVYLVYREDIPPTLTDIEPAVTMLKGLIAEQWHTPIVSAIAAFWLLSLLLSISVLFERKPAALKEPEKSAAAIGQHEKSDEMLKEIGILREKLLQTEATATESRDKANQLLSQNENLKAQLEKFSASSAENAEAAELRTQLVKLQGDLKISNSAVEKAESELKNLLIEQKKVSEELAAARNKLDKAENDSRTIKKDAEKTAGQLKNAQSELSSKTEEAASLRKQIEELTNELKAAQADARGGKNAVPPAAYQILYLFQKEGRLIDLLKEDVSGYDDETLGGAIRPIHEGCRKLLEDRLILEPVLNEEEGSEVTLDEIDPESIKLSGSVPASGPYT